MLGYSFTEFLPDFNKKQATFDQLLNIFLQLLTITSGNVSEALSWLTNIDKQYNLTKDNYGLGDFIEDLKTKGFLDENPATGEFVITPKSEQAIRKSALDEIFGQIKKSGKGNHSTLKSGIGDENIADLRAFEFGDTPDQIAFTESFRNAHINNGVDDFILTEKDLEVNDKEHKSQTSTVLMIDISHSMILYGEDRITPAKKVAMALSELITKKYPKDSLDIIVFGNDTWQIQIKDLPYLNVGPYHTNTIAGLELAMDLLRKRKSANKQIFMITDGKPTCMKIGKRYYKNSFGMDSKILNKTLNLAVQCRKMHIIVTTFMVANDPYLQEFVKEFTEANQGHAYYTGLKGLGELVFEDYKKNKHKRF